MKHYWLRKWQYKFKNFEEEHNTIFLVCQGFYPLLKCTIPRPNFHERLFYSRSGFKITTLKLLISLSRILVKWFCGSPKNVLQPHPTSEIDRSDTRKVYHSETDLVRYTISTPLSTHKSVKDPVP
jgi:hypothetical protein